MAPPHRMRAYSLMKLPKLQQCITELENGYGDACSSKRLGVYSKVDHLAAARNALLTHYPSYYKARYPSPSAPGSIADPMEVLRKRFEEIYHGG